MGLLDEGDGGEGLTQWITFIQLFHIDFQTKAANGQAPWGILP